MGYTVLNPVTICEVAGAKSYGECLLLCVQALKSADGIYLLKNWKESSGAKVEREIAELLASVNPKFVTIYESETEAI